MVKRWELSYGMHRNGTCTYHVNVFTMKRWKWYRARLYHWYDMKIPTRIPGWKRFDKWLRDMGAEHRHFVGVDHEGKARLQDRIYGWTVEQDLRCYYFSNQCREKEVYLKLTEDEYKKLGGKHGLTPPKTTKIGRTV